MQDEVRSHNVGQSDYATRKIQPWDIVLEYGLNFFDGNILKYLLRKKATDCDPRKQDYEKIIHYCQERIRQIDDEIVIKANPAIIFHHTDESPVLTFNANGLAIDSTIAGIAVVPQDKSDVAEQEEESVESGREVKSKKQQYEESAAGFVEFCADESNFKYAPEPPHGNPCGGCFFDGRCSFADEFNNPNQEGARCCTKESILIVKDQPSD